MSAAGKVHLLGHCVAGDEHRSAELLMFDNSMFSVGLQTLVQSFSARGSVQSAKKGQGAAQCDNSLPFGLKEMHTQLCSLNHWRKLPDFLG